MKKIVFISLLSLFSHFAFTQSPTAKKIQLNENTVVKDTSGSVFPYSIWSSLLMTGHYNIKPENPGDENTAFVMTRLTDEQYEKKMQTMPKPRESNSFTTGQKFVGFKEKDIHGNKINTKNYAGKIIVLNFWFVKCQPCVREMPQLNELVFANKDDSSIVFISICLDDPHDINEFLKTQPFFYKIIDKGRFLSERYSVRSYPTHVIIDKEGKIAFHTTGLAANTVYWLKKTINELKAPPETDEKKESGSETSTAL